MTNQVSTPIAWDGLSTPPHPTTLKPAPLPLRTQADLDGALAAVRRGECVEEVRAALRAEFGSGIDALLRAVTGSLLSK
jgi:hypothetical protein